MELSGLDIRAETRSDGEKAPLLQLAIETYQAAGRKKLVSREELASCRTTCNACPKQQRVQVLSYCHQFISY
jgi:hypothetical protein